MYVYRTYVYIKVLLVSIACISCGGHSSDGELPKASDIPLTDSVNHKIQASERKSIKEKLGVKETVRVPVNEGPMIGNPYKVGVDHIPGEDTLYMFDSEFSEFKMYSSRGRYLNNFGEPGAGPGRFQAVEDFIPYVRKGSKKIAVVSRGRRVQFFNYSKSAFEQSESGKVPFEARSGCAVDGSIFIHGSYVGPKTLEEESTVFKISSEANITDSFGPKYDHAAWIVEYALSEGVIGCDSTNNVISFSFSHSGIIYGYNTNGKIEWVSRIGPFNSVSRSHVSSEGSVREGKKEGTDRVTRIIDVPGDGMIVERRHIEEISLGMSRPDYSFHHYFISSKDGSGRYLGRSDMTILDVGSGWLAGVNENSLTTLKLFYFDHNSLQ